MQISGIKKTTLIDYPGKVATLIFTLGCNFRCKYCHNSQFVLPESVKERIPFLIKEEAFFNFLDKRKDFLDGVVICGGEPTIHSDLKDFCVKIKEKTGLLIKLDTNGTNPEILKELINESLIDYVAMDIKDDLDSGDLIGVNKNEKIKESIEILKEGRVDYEFRTTFINGYHTEEKIDSILKTVSGAKSFIIQNYRPGDILDKTFEGKGFSEEELMTLKDKFSKEIDSVKVK